MTFRISPKRRLQDSRKKQVDHRDKILSGLFQQHRLLAKVLLLRWPFQLASLAKYYCFVGQVSNHASQPYFPSDPTFINSIWVSSGPEYHLHNSGSSLYLKLRYWPT